MLRPSGSSSLSPAKPRPPQAMAGREVLMLEAPLDPSREGWSVINQKEFIDALPYIDDDYGDPRVKAEVDTLVEAEMRKSVKKPADFLKDLPPLLNFDFEVGQLPICLSLV